MQTVRPAIAVDPRRFGRRAMALTGALPRASFSFSDDVRLFAATYLAGFLFVTVLIA